MTKEEFESEYAERTGVAMEYLEELGLEGRPCDCGDPICKGWKMTTVRGCVFNGSIEPRSPGSAQRR